MTDLAQANEHVYRGPGPCIARIITKFDEVQIRMPMKGGGPGRPRNDGSPRHRPVTDDRNEYARCGKDEADHD